MTESSITYAEKTIRRDFHELGPDVWVEIRNPLLMPEEKLQTRPPRVDDKGNVDRDDAYKKAREMMAGLIVDWHVFDYDTDDLLDIPTQANLGRCPVAITNWIGKLVQEARDPSV